MVYEVSLFRTLSSSENYCFVTLPGSKSSASNNSKKTSSSSSGKKTTLSSHPKALSANSKKTTKSKVKEKILRRYAWIYVGILFAAMIVPLILHNHLIVQSVSVSCMWAGMYYFCTFVDHVVVSSRK